MIFDDRQKGDSAQECRCFVAAATSIQGGKLTFHYKMYRQSEILQDAFQKAVKSIGESLQADILLGNPS